MTCEFLHVASVSVAETTYLVVSSENGAPGSCSTVRVDHAGSNIGSDSTGTTVRLQVALSPAS